MLIAPELFLLSLSHRHPNVKSCNHTSQTRSNWTFLDKGPDIFRTKPKLVNYATKLVPSVVISTAHNVITVITLAVRLAARARPLFTGSNCPLCLREPAIFPISFYVFRDLKKPCTYRFNCSCEQTRTGCHLASFSLTPSWLSLHLSPPLSLSPSLTLRSSVFFSSSSPPFFPITHPFFPPSLSSGARCLCMLSGPSPWQPLLALRPTSGLAKHIWLEEESGNRGGGEREIDREGEKEGKRERGRERGRETKREREN